MNIFVELSLILVITTIFATIARFLRQPLLVGYIAAGVVIGPIALNIFSSHHELELFSKFGIAILLFIVGIHLNPETLKETGKPAFFAGLLQIILTTLAGYFLLKTFNVAVGSAIALSFAMALSSTIVVLKMLSDTGEMSTVHGKILVGILLVQDIAATLGLVLLPLTQQGDAGIGFAFLKLLGSGFAVGATLYLVSKYLLPVFSDYLAKSSELLLLFSLSWGLILAAVFYKIGFSIEVGALVAGVTLSSSKYAHEISSRLRPLRDVFVALFFVLLGVGIDLSSWSNNIVLVIILSLFVLVGNPLIVYVVMRLRSYQRRTSLSAALALGQVSEFSLIFLALAANYAIITPQAITIATLVTILTIIGSSYLYEKRSYIFTIVSLLDRYNIEGESAAQKETDQQYDLLVFGFGRVGLEFMQAATAANMTALAIDYNPDVFGGKRVEGKDVVFGDADDIEFLTELPMSTASYVISTVPNLHTNLLILDTYRKENPEGNILLLANTPHEADVLYDHGATYVILPHYLGAYHATNMFAQHTKDSDIFKKERELQSLQIQRQVI